MTRSLYQRCYSDGVNGGKEGRNRGGQSHVRSSSWAVCLVERLCLTGPAELLQVPRQRVPPTGWARAEKAMALVKERWVDFRLGSTSQLSLAEHNALWGMCQKRQSSMYPGPRLFRAIKVNTRTLNQIQYSTWSRAASGAQVECVLSVECL